MSCAAVQAACSCCCNPPAPHTESLSTMRPLSLWHRNQVLQMAQPWSHWCVATHTLTHKPSQGYAPHTRYTHTHQCPGVLVYSEFTAGVNALRDAAVVVNPYDTEGMV